MASDNAKTVSEGDLNLQLMRAAENCDLHLVKELLNSGANAGFIHDPPGVWGSCSKKGPLHVALKRGPPREMSGSDGEDMLKTWTAMVQTLIEAKADVNASCAEYDWRGCGSTETAFMLALPYAMRDVAFLELFLAAGADADTKLVRERHSMRTDGRSVEFVLHTAVAKSNLEVARALLDAGATVNSVASAHFHNERGFNENTEETPLHRACAAAEPDLGMCALLLARGANVDAIRKELEQAPSGAESPTDDPRDSEFVSSVVCVPVQETALHMAIRRGNADLVVMLVCAGADASIARSRGGTMTTCEELCEGDEGLLKMLKAEWTPETHKLFPPMVRESVKAALLIARRQEWPLPDTVLFRVCALAAAPGTD